MAPSKKREKEQTVATTAATNAAAVVSSATATVNGNGILSVNSNGVESINGSGASGGVGIGNGIGGALNAHTMATQAAAESMKPINGHQQEQELFLQAFEKPTQIYRYLRNRHDMNPIFLNRTLSYMKDRMSRNHKKRATLKVDDIATTLTKKSEVVIQNYLHIIFDALYEKIEDDTNRELLWPLGEMVEVEAVLFKITRSKRKDSTLDFQEVLCKSSNVLYNPKENVREHPTISIPVQSMRPMGDQHTLYKLCFRIKCLQTYTTSMQENEENEVTPKKRAQKMQKIYGCELILYEKASGFLSEGEYEAMLQPINQTTIKSFSPKKCTWEYMSDNYIPATMHTGYDAYEQHPKLKFHLTLSDNIIPAVLIAQELQKYAPHINVTAPAFNEQQQQSSIAANMEINHNNNCVKNNSDSIMVNGNNTTTNITNGAGGGSSSSKKPENVQLVYNFMYSNNTRQQTEYTRELICPWCNINCLRLYALLKHLKLCHARFNFTYSPQGSCARIDVTINDAYDGSYAGSPCDLASPSGSSFARTSGPVRRTTVTSLLVCRPRRQKTCLDEFYELEDDDLSNNRSYVTGHNRLYHHTETCLPVHPKELDIDSEGESDPQWLRQKTIQMIDEFSDVNEGEKELMKLWNLHIMKHGFVGDCQLPLACEMFLDAKGHEIIRKNLYRNFILHISSLFDYGLISPDTVYKMVQRLQGMLSRYAAGLELMSNQRETQLRYWLEVGIHKQDEQKLKSPQKQQAINNNSNNTATKDNQDNGNNEKNSNTKKTAAISTTPLKSRVAANETMPAPKRMPNTTKRVSALLAASVAEKLGNGANGNGAANSSKNVARKSADILKRGATSNEATTTTKRRLLSRENTTQPASKRQRTDNSQNNHTANGGGAGGVNVNTSSTSSSSATRSGTAAAAAAASTKNASILPAASKRLLTRSKSATEVANTNTPNHKNNDNNKTTNGLTTAAINKTKSKSNAHGLRTRLSMPLTKVERR